jgi:hypothetical protein
LRPTTGNLEKFGVVDETVHVVVELGQGPSGAPSASSNSTISRSLSKVASPPNSRIFKTDDRCRHRHQLLRYSTIPGTSQPQLPGQLGHNQPDLLLDDRIHPLAISSPTVSQSLESVMGFPPSSVMPRRVPGCHSVHNGPGPGRSFVLGISHAVTRNSSY